MLFCEETLVFERVGEGFLFLLATGLVFGSFFTVGEDFVDDALVEGTPVSALLLFLLDLTGVSLSPAFLADDRVLGSRSLEWFAFAGVVFCFAGTAIAAPDADTACLVRLRWLPLDSSFESSRSLSGVGAANFSCLLETAFFTMGVFLSGDWEGFTAGRVFFTGLSREGQFHLQLTGINRILFRFGMDPLILSCLL